GRGIWILDDITPLRQIGGDPERVALRPPGDSRRATGDSRRATGDSRRATGDSRRATLSGSPVLFKPQIAYRVRQNTNTDTPIPPDEAAGTNPPDGAILDYMLASAAAGPVT